ncbi:hypothetical protein Prum_067590 [Phytohabitans rumicis]|uniref:Uncharacterized protein n=1 Tax=Phytohabitans rumicis TaxID=1076125 RepID=A0A6V8LGB2_9ACTN|nr:hypothetical protein Prum_067590 [Phytohabitans rumicis]
MRDEDTGCFGAIAGLAVIAVCVAAAFGKLPLWIWVIVGIGGAIYVIFLAVSAYHLVPYGVRRWIGRNIRKISSAVGARRQARGTDMDRRARSVGMDDWSRLSQRGPDARHEALSEGVPDHLRGPLAHWLECQFLAIAIGRSGSEEKALRIATRARVDLNGDKFHYSEKWAKYTNALIDAAGKAQPTVLLDIIDAALFDRVHQPTHPMTPDQPGHPEQLDEILRDGNSVYRVRRPDCAGLERRVDETVASAVRHAADSGPGQHLKASWDAAYALHPNASVAYAEAVKAVEEVLVPLVLPGENKATLGGVLGKWKTTANQWELAIADGDANPASIDPLVSLTRLLWQGHRDRHAGTPTAVDVTPEAARMAMHAAATIVQWTVEGGLRQRRVVPPPRSSQQVQVRGRGGPRRSLS